MKYKWFTADPLKGTSTYLQKLFGMKFSIREMFLKDDLITTITKVVSGGRITWALKSHFSEIPLYEDILVQSLDYKIEPMNFKIILDTEHEKNFSSFKNT